jgi:hypothetical protein
MPASAFASRWKHVIFSSKRQSIDVRAFLRGTKEIGQERALARVKWRRRWLRGPRIPRERPALALRPPAAREPCAGRRNGRFARRRASRASRRERPVPTRGWRLRRSMADRPRPSRGELPRTPVEKYLVDLDSKERAAVADALKAIEISGLRAAGVRTRQIKGKLWEIDPQRVRLEPNATPVRLDFLAVSEPVSPPGAFSLPRGDAPCAKPILRPSSPG